MLPRWLYRLIYTIYSWSWIELKKIPKYYYRYIYIYLTNESYGCTLINDSSFTTRLNEVKRDVKEGGVRENSQNSWWPFRLWHSTGWLSRRTRPAGGWWTISSRARNCTTPLKFHEGLADQAGRKGRGASELQFIADKGAKLWRLTHRLATNGIPRASIGQARLITPTTG